MNQEVAEAFIKKIIIWFLIVLNLWAMPYNIEEKVAPFDLKDQFGRNHHIGVMPHTLILAFEKATSFTVNNYLSMQNKKYLDTYNAIFIVDISRVPSFFIQLFGIPKMQKYSYQILLTNDEKFVHRFSSQKGKITIIHFKENMVSSISFVCSRDELKRAIESQNKKIFSQK